MKQVVVLISLLCPHLSWCDFNLSVIHFNDFHARYEPINNLSGRCTNKDVCIGGFSRLYATATKLKKNHPNSLLLNAGDNFRGSLWYNVHKWNVTQHFINKLPLDALTIGNHEFDDKVDGLVPYLQHIKHPVVVANIDESQEPKLKGLYNKSIVIEKGGKKIGIIGVLTSMTKFLSRPENVNFLDESLSINSEAQRLVQSENVFTNIILSHCGYNEDIELAEKSDFKISLIVGGHTDTFLYTGGRSPGPDIPQGPYPTVVLNKNHEKVLVVQASAYTKYLGDLTINYDEFTKEVKDFQGSPIFLDSILPTNPEIDQELELWKGDIDIIGQEIIGHSLFSMSNKLCRSGECRLGNFATDAMIDWYSRENGSVSIAIIHPGGLRTSLSQGDISYNDLATVFPFEDTIDIIEIKGAHLWEILEKSVDDYRVKHPHFYQVSGMLLQFNISKPKGSRLETCKVRCNSSTRSDCDLDLNKIYRVALNGFLINSGFQPLFQEYSINKIEGSLDLDVYSAYLKNHNPLITEIQNRTVIVK